MREGQQEIGRGRAGLERDLLATVARGGALLLVGAHGSGRTTALQAVADSVPGTAVGVGARLLADEPLGIVRHALRTGDPVDTEAVVAALAGRPLLLDDLQWADPASLDLVADLVGRVPVVATVAEDDAAVGAVLARLPGVEQRVLGPLGDDDAASLLGERGLPPDAVARQVAWAGGDLALLVAPADAPAPPPVAWALVQRAEAIGADGRRVVAALSLAGGSAPAAALDPATVAQLAGRGIVAVDDGAVGLRQGALGAVVADLLADERAALLRELAAASSPAVAAALLEAAGDPGEAEASARAALAAGDGLGAVERADLLALQVRCASGPADAELQRALAEALLAAGRPTAAVAPALAAGAHEVVVGAHRQAGRAAAAIDALRAASSTAAAPPLVREADRLRAWPGGAEVAAIGLAAPEPPTVPPGDPDLADWDARVAAGASTVGGRLAAGALDEAAAAVAALAEGLVAAPPGPWDHTTAILAAVVGLHRGDGLGALVADLEPVVALEHPLPGVAAAHLALAIADGGRASDALALLDGAASGDRAPLGADAVALAWGRAEVELVAGRPRQAHRAAASAPLGDDLAAAPAWTAALAVARAWADHDAGLPVERPSSGVGGAAAAEVAGLVALAEDRPADAAAAFDRAAGAWASDRAARRSRWAAADALRQAGAHPESVARLQALEAELEAAGLLPLLARVRQSLRRAGIRAQAGGAGAGAGRAAASAAERHGGLSRREAEVLDLVAEGLPSAEIARRLGVGRSTVETQIASAMRKLGARTRRQAAALHLEASAP